MVDTTLCLVAPQIVGQGSRTNSLDKSTLVESYGSEWIFGEGGGQLVQLLSYAHAGDGKNRLTPLSNYHKGSHVSFSK